MIRFRSSADQYTDSYPSSHFDDVSKYSTSLSNQLGNDVFLGVVEKNVMTVSPPTHIVT